MRSPASRRRKRCPITSPISSAPFRRAIVLVMDSVGVGELPDAAAYGDQGSNTVGNIAKRVPLKVPTLRSLGFDRIADLGGHTGPPLRDGERSGLRNGERSGLRNGERSGLRNGEPSGLRNGER